MSAARAIDPKLITLKIEKIIIDKMQSIRLLNTDVKYIVQNDIFWYCLRDVAYALDYKVESGSNKFYKCYINQIPKQYIICSTLQGPRKALFTDKSGLKYLLAKSRKPKVPELLEALGHKDIIAAPTKEAIYVTELNTMFPSLKFREQFRVEDYKVDLYSPIWNIIVECDEMDHKASRYTNDQTRTEKINIALSNPIWVRFNPDAKDFSVKNLIAQITDAMTSRYSFQNI